ncbi:MAG: hypothetical protein JW959_14970 [Pirellulales bacterium]|nr:hypothetical protein [Pirellulales bacterium]
MSIIVACPNCRKSFKVSDKFAGKSGPCPNCKNILHVPEKGEEVKIHAPEQFAEGGRTKTGKLITKPIARTDAKFQPLTAVIIVAASAVALVVTFIGGRAGLFQGYLFAALGLLVVSPPLAIVAYEILRDDELEPYRGLPLYVRAAVCGTAYVVLWGIFSLLASRGVITGELWNWAIVLPPFVVAGGMTAVSCLDLEFGNGMFHYGFYLLVTLVLRWAAGMAWIWEF